MTVSGKREDRHSLAVARYEIGSFLLTLRWANSSGFVLQPKREMYGAARRASLRRNSAVSGTRSFAFMCSSLRYCRFRATHAASRQRLLVALDDDGGAEEHRTPKDD